MLQERPDKPDADWLKQSLWNSAFDVNDTLAAFKGIHRDLTATPCWIQLGDTVVR